ncbi:MAG: hypothetical protein H6R18_1958 [Proteobacteria bacterium]|nr:hypothetical protein [Pseudomonadota bacterium]
MEPDRLILYPAKIKLVARKMPSDPGSEHSELETRPIVEWLAASHDNTRPEDVPALRKHLETLRNAQLSAARRVQLLDFLYEHSVKVVSSILPDLRNIPLPVSRKSRQDIRSAQDLLESLSQDYLSLIDSTFESEESEKLRSPEVAIWRAVKCLALHLMMSHLASAPPEVGIWRMLHDAHGSARHYDLTDRRIPRQERTLEELYLSSMLLACCQPSSFSAVELEFIADYIQICVDSVSLLEEVPPGQEGLFWIDPHRDAPVYALSRRNPPPDTSVLFLACDAAARCARDHLDALEKGYPANQLDLPDYAETPAGHGVLRRLIARWGRPPKRKYPRRRHSYRATLCAGLEELWCLLDKPDSDPPDASEWMILNESAEGWAMMHLSGKTEHLHVGDLVAVRPEAENGAPAPAWTVCIVRWALSENPEHIEMGLQVLAPTALPAVLAVCRNGSGLEQGEALLLPRIPPLRPTEALVVPTGLLDGQPEKFTIVIGNDNIVIRELRTIAICDQTASVEVFSVEAEKKA